MAHKANLEGKLTLEDAEFRKKIDEAIEKAQDFGKELAAQAREGAMQVAELVGVFEALDKAMELVSEGIEGVKSSLELGARLQDLHNSTGVAVGDLLEIQQAFKANGASADAVAGSIRKMQRSIEAASSGSTIAMDQMEGGMDEAGQAMQQAGGKANSVYERLGINIKALKAMAPEEQFKTLAEKIGDLQDPAERTSVAMQIFGRSGAELNGLFLNKDAFEEAGQALGGQAAILQHNAEVFKAVTEDMKMVGTKIQGFFVGLADPIANTLEPVFDQIKSLDLSGMGEQLGQGISEAMTVLYNAVSQGRLGELAGDSLKYAAAVFGDYLIGAVQALGDGIGKSFGVLVNEIGPIIGGIAQSLVGAAGVFGYALIDAFAQPLNMLVDGFIYAADLLSKMLITNITAAFQLAIHELMPVITALDKAAGTSIAPQISAVGTGLAQATQIKTFDQFEESNQNKANFAGFTDADAGKTKSEEVFSDGMNMLKAPATALGAAIVDGLKGFRPSNFFQSEEKSNGDKLAKDISDLNTPLGSGKKKEPDKDPGKDPAAALGAATGKANTEGLKGIVQNARGGFSLFEENEKVKAGYSATGKATAVADDGGANVINQINQTLTNLNNVIQGWK